MENIPVRNSIEPFELVVAVYTEPVVGSYVGNSINCKGRVEGEHCYLWLVVEIVDQGGKSLFWPKDEITNVDIKENGEWSKQIFDESPPGLQPEELSISLWNVRGEGHKMTQDWIREGSERERAPAFPPLRDIEFGKWLFRVDGLVKGGVEIPVRWRNQILLLPHCVDKKPQF